MIQPTNGRPDEQTSTNDVAASEWHALLSHELRCAVIDVLADRTESVSLSELAATVAERADRDERETLVSLHHCHLPKAADAGLLDYQPESRRVEQPRIPANPLP